MNTSVQEIADTPHLFGVNFQECLEGVMSAGFSIEESIVSPPGECWTGESARLSPNEGAWSRPLREEDQ